jgi:hypothetical protein
MKMEVRHFSARPQVFECLAHGVTGHGEYTPMRDGIGLDFMDRLDRTARQWDVAAVAILR